MGERCRNCDKPVATEEDWETTPEGEGEHLCWGQAACTQVDWRARALAAEAERDAARAEVDTAKATNRRLHALLMGDHAALGEALGRGPQDLDQATEAARELRAERDRLRAIAEGRGALPTEAEALAHDEKHGLWLVVSMNGHGTTVVDVCGLSVACLDASRVLRVYALDADRRIGAWPEVSHG